KVIKRPTKQTSYLRATLKGMALTFSHLLRPKVTMQYPEEKSSKDWTLSSRWRGTHRMLTDEQGRAKCVACGLCPQICPANCIKLVPGEDEEGHRYPLIYEIDEFRCINRRRVIARGCWLVVTLVAVRALVVLPAGQCIRPLQVLVYAGAIIVQLLSIIMLLSLVLAGPTNINGPGGELAAVVVAGEL